MRCAGSCSATARPSATCRGPRAGSRAAGGLSSGCGGCSGKFGAGGAGADAEPRCGARTQAPPDRCRSRRRYRGAAFNKAVARIYELTGAIEKAALSASRSDAIRTLLLLVSPMMPHLAEEAWAQFRPAWACGRSRLADGRSGAAGGGRSHHCGAAQGQTARYADRRQGLPQAELEALALASEKVQRSLDGAEVRKVIVVPDRLVNIVT